MMILFVHIGKTGGQGALAVSKSSSAALSCLGFALEHLIRGSRKGAVQQPVSHLEACHVSTHNQLLQGLLWGQPDSCAGGVIGIGPVHEGCLGSQAAVCKVLQTPPVQAPPWVAPTKLLDPKMQLRPVESRMHAFYTALWLIELTVLL